MNPLSKTPVLSLLVPLVSGILLQYYLKLDDWCILFFVLGALIMLLSYFTAKDKRYTYRWLFGFGVTIFCIGIGIFFTQYRQQESEFVFESKKNIYKGIVVDIPQDKAKTTAYKVILPDYDKKIVCYFCLDSLNSEKLKPGDEFLFSGIIQPFRNFKENIDFDYVTYMHNQGYAGSAYVTLWKTTGSTDTSLKIYAQRWRQRILDLYWSLGFNDEEFAILSALTLGYRDAMSDDLEQAFRTTGTIHVLSVSGLHVGIIYLMIAFLLSPIRRTSKLYRIKPILIILFLWIYAFLTGLSPSVTRASIMLTMFCLATCLNRKSYPINAMYMAAFLILLCDPLSLFHVGFQLSFLSVAGILYLYPEASTLIKSKSKLVNYVWQGFAISSIAQLATFPLCLYYFGTFPIYFLVTNLIVIPLITVIMYSFSGIIVAKIVSFILPVPVEYLFYIPVKVLQFLLWLLIECIHFFEKLPYAQIQDAQISLPELCLLYGIIILISIFFLKRKTICPKRG